MGRHGVGVITDNGERLVNFCQQNGRWRHSLQEVREMQHADTGSDHSLLVAKVTLKLRKAKTVDIRNQRYDVSKLKDSKVKE
ncbi:hypothetical protein DPMN_017944 [Dreissena polymorpha]|uniref:Uncharacterized protein n=1 Tax=Dreissena polymorpha TaxID=45954 RepID=A0A9D4NCD1_DREPO|nr:hypothetical protein DPMN_017944 [Dreissena polymorpha]